MVNGYETLLHTFIQLNPRFSFKIVLCITLENNFC